MQLSGPNPGQNLYKSSSTLKFMQITCFPSILGLVAIVPLVY